MYKKLVKVSLFIGLASSLNAEIIKDIKDTYSDVSQKGAKIYNSIFAKGTKISVNKDDDNGFILICICQ
jgi:hypothetical protein